MSRNSAFLPREKYVSQSVAFNNEKEAINQLLQTITHNKTLVTINSSAETSNQLNNVGWVNSLSWRKLLSSNLDKINAKQNTHLKYRPTSVHTSTHKIGKAVTFNMKGRRNSIQVKRRNSFSIKNNKAPSLTILATNATNRLISNNARYFQNRNLEYEIERNELRNKVGPKKKFEKSHEMSINSFLSNQKNKACAYQPCLKYSKNYVYNLPNKLYYKNKFCPNKAKESYLQDGRTQSQRNLTRSKSMEIIEQMKEVMWQVNEDEEELQKNIKNNNEWENLFHSPKQAHNKSKDELDIRRIVKEFKLDEKKNRGTDKGALLKKNLKKWWDDRCQGFWTQIYNKINYEDKRWNNSSKVIDVSSNNLSELKNDFFEVAREIIILKKKYKGINAILPINEANFWNKQIKKEEEMNQFSSIKYLEELIKKKNIMMKIKPNSQVHAEKKGVNLCWRKKIRKYELK